MGKLAPEHHVMDLFDPTNVCLHGSKVIMEPTDYRARTQKVRRHRQKELLVTLKILSNPRIALLGEHGWILNPSIPSGLDITNYRLPATVGSVSIRPVLWHAILVVHTIIVVLLTWCVPWSPVVGGVRSVCPRVRR